MHTEQLGGITYGTPNCPECGELVAGEVDVIPGRAEMDQQEDGSFEYSGSTEMFWDGQMNERDWDGKHPGAKRLADVLRDVMWHLDARLMARPDEAAQEVYDRALAVLAQYEKDADTSTLVTVECGTAHRWDTTKEERD